MPLPYVRAWRVEHPVRLQGPFREDNAGATCGCREGWDNMMACQHYWPHPNPFSMPAPGQETVRRNQPGRSPYLRGRVCAFRDFATFRRYFGPYVAQRMHKMGYVGRVFAVPWNAHHVYRVNLAFDRDRATVLREFSLGDYARQLEAELAVLRALQVAGDIDPITQRRAA